MAVQVTGTHTETDVPTVVDALVNARSVVIVPGYGLAVSGGQYDIAELVKILTSKGIKVRCAGAP